MGFETLESGSFGESLQLVGVEESNVNQEWIQPWGEKRVIRDSHAELRITLRQRRSPHRQMTVVFRVFNDGLGFRYEWPLQSDLAEFAIRDELTEFRVAGDPDCWWIPAFQDNRYEYLYQKTKLSEAPTIHTPATMRTREGVHLCIHEAALTNFASMTLAKGHSNAREADLVPWSDGVRVRAATPFRSPWRTIQVSPTAAGLLDSYLILNLNEPCTLFDTSWIEPGKYAGVWWEMHLNTKTWGSGDNHGATTENTMKHIDFAAANGMSGVLVEGWNHGWDGNWIENGNGFSFTEPYADFDLNRVAQYARDKNVRLIGHHETAGGIVNYERQLSAAFALYEQVGVRAVKTGYVAYGTDIMPLGVEDVSKGEWHHGQFMVRHYRRVIEEAAKHRIMLNVHEPIKDTGIRRTYPNMMTREGARGQEYNAWSEDGGNPPDHTTILPFTRMMAGPMDFCPGLFDLLYEQERPANRVNTTLAKQLALYVVLYSPLQMAPDLPENYEDRQDALQFIRDVPADWEDTKPLAGEIGDYVVVARQRRGGDDWFLGAVTDENAREISVPLDFLEAGKPYLAEVYADGPGADWEENPYDYTVAQREVVGGEKLDIWLAPGGGCAVRLVPLEK